ncbi:MAG: helix-hairpin-helix domain-containing protein [Bryobacterales bacterium]|nr:helix-hairpin-helix domain-containing protein [Bryobacterales bacterium]
MKALTALPTQAYVQAGEEANIPLQELLKLVQELETNVSPAYIARYRPDIAAGLDAARIQAVQERLRSFLDLADRRVTILTAINQQERLTPELREQIEGSMDRRELEDLYLPFKPKRRTAADDAVEKGLESLALFLWKQEGGAAELDAEAAKSVDAAGSAEAALAGACDIIARWLGENAEIRRDIRKLAQAEAEISVQALQPQRRLSGRDENLRKRFAAMDGYRALVAKAPWRQVLSLRRGAREGWLQFQIEVPEQRALHYLEGRLVREAESAFAPWLQTAAKRAFEDYLAPAVAKELRQELDERCDAEAVQLYKKNLRKLMLASPAGPRPMIGLETNRPGGWRAAVIGPDGSLLEAAIVRPDEAEEAAEAQQDETQQDEPQADESAEATEAEASEGEAATEASSQDQPASEEAPAEAPVVAEAAPAPEPQAEAEQPAPEPVVAEPVVAEPVASEPSTPVQAELFAEPAEPVAAEVSAPVDSAALEAPAAEAAPEEAAAEAAPVPEAPAAAEPEQPEPAEPEAAQPATEQPEVAQPEAKAPSRDSNKRETPVADLSDLISRHQVELIVFGNGPGLRQVERFVRLAVRKSGRNAAWIAANEAGSWIYATSKTARKELPDQEPAVRSAACLARRVQDPMGELIKLDPRVLGIGQGHHEVDQKHLRTALRDAQEAAVQETGVDVNHAPADLLALVPGMTERVAKRIVEHRKQHGPFASRAALSQMSGLNARVYDQAAGFLRVYGGDNPLDATGVHPRDYAKLEQLFQAAGVDAQQALANPAALANVNLAELADKDHSQRALEMIVRELAPKARNPRGAFQMPKPDLGVDPIDEPTVGMKVEGVITNVADFGLFVDIGAEQDGLVHVSQLAPGVTREGDNAVKSGDRITVYVVNVANDGKRISLSMREPRETSRQRRVSVEGRRAAESHRRGRDDNRGPRPDRDRTPIRRTFGPDGRKEDEKIKNMSLDQKLNALQDKFRTKV